MKLKDRLTNQNKQGIFNGEYFGIFQDMILNSDSFYSLKEDLCLSYYFGRSGEKKLSPFYEALIVGEENGYIEQGQPELLIGKNVRNKYINKWTKIYSALNDNYNPINDMDYNETYTDTKIEDKNHDNTHKKTGNNSEDITYNTQENKNEETQRKEIVTETYNDTKIEDKNHGNTYTKTGNNAEDITYNTQEDTNEETQKREIVTENNTTNDNVYGFNSSSPVGDTTQDSENTTITSQNPNENIVNTGVTKTGTDEKQFTIDEKEVTDETENNTITLNSENTKTISQNPNENIVNTGFTKTGTDEKQFTINEQEIIDETEKNTITLNSETNKSGRNVSGAKLLDEELEFRNKQTFFDIVFKDIDYIVTRPLY